MTRKSQDREKTNSYKQLLELVKKPTEVIEAFGLDSTSETDLDDVLRAKTKEITEVQEDALSEETNTRAPEEISDEDTPEGEIMTPRI